MKKYNFEIGRLGENIAKEYLEKQGYKILKQNYRNKYAEIDLVIQDKDTLVFVEVKTRIGEQFGLPERALNRNKIYRLIRNSQAYMLKKEYNNMNYRIDAVCIVLDENRQPIRIDHYENIIN